MKKNLYMKKPLYLILITFITSAILGILFLGTLQIEKEFTKRMVEISTSDIISISDNSANSIKNILKDSNDYINDIIVDEGLQQVIEKQLEVLLTKNIKYAYLLYKDKNDIFRFLADASKEDKALVNQKLDILNTEWLDLYKTKKPQLIKQLFLKELSITYLIPILKDNEVELVVVVDFAVEKVKEIYDMINFVKNSILLIIIIILVFLFVLIIQAFRYYLVKKKAFIDKLTGVYNRNYLQESENFINLSEYIIAAVDIDHFKKINDTYGHDNGDLILKQVAQTILKCTRKKEDIVVRYGGEEFLVLARTKRNNKLIALNVLERILESIQKESFTLTNDELLKVTVSIGVNLVPEESRTFQEAFKLSDIALYNAKNKGRNKLIIYTDETTNSDYLTINEIKEAIEDNRITCHYQSIINTKTKEVSHYEALARIISKDNQIILPNKFFPILDGTFISRNLTKEILIICYNKLVEKSDIKISVNLSPQDIVNDSIFNILKAYALNPEISTRLALEIIESEEIHDYAKLKKYLLELKKLGYELFIDDFGSGYSNFIYLTEIQTDYIKIDGLIINKILDDHISYLVVKNIVNFAKEANIKVVAEFVSSKEIFNKIKTLDIDYVQGYLFSKPSDNLDD